MKKVAEMKALLEPHFDIVESFGADATACWEHLQMDGSQAVLQNIQFLIGHGIKSGNNQKSCGTVACLANTPDRQGHAGLDCQK